MEIIEKDASRAGAEQARSAAAAARAKGVRAGMTVTRAL
jgi:hypothetical protein